MKIRGNTGDESESTLYLGKTRVFRAFVSRTWYISARGEYIEVDERCIVCHQGELEGIY